MLRVNKDMTNEQMAETVGAIGVDQVDNNDMGLARQGANKSGAVRFSALLVQNRGVLHEAMHMVGLKDRNPEGETGPIQGASSEVFEGTIMGYYSKYNKDLATTNFYDMISAVMKDANGKESASGVFKGDIKNETPAGEYPSGSQEDNPIKTN